MLTLIRTLRTRGRTLWRAGAAVRPAHQEPPAHPARLGRGSGAEDRARRGPARRRMPEERGRPRGARIGRAGEGDARHLRRPVRAHARRLSPGKSPRAGRDRRRLPAHRRRPRAAATCCSGSVRKSRNWKRRSSRNPAPTAAATSTTKKAVMAAGSTSTANRRRGLAACALALALLSLGAGFPEHYGADAGGTRYAPLADITPDNVRDLAIAWTYRSGDLERRDAATMRRTKFQTTPDPGRRQARVVHAVQRGHRARSRLGRARSGATIRRSSTDYRPANLFNCRGVALWRDPAATPGSGLRSAHLHRDQRRPGHRARSCFGKALRRIRRERRGPASRSACRCCIPSELQITSPPVAAGGVVIVGSAINDNQRVASPRGTVHAFDARSGQAALAVGSDSARRRGSGGEDLGRGLEDHRQRERLGADVGRSRARPGLPADLQPEPGLLRRPEAGRQPVREFRRRAQAGDRRDRLALPDRAPRRLGLRRAGAADAGDDHASTASRATS